VYARLEKFGLRPDHPHKAVSLVQGPTAAATGALVSEAELRWERRSLALLRVDLTNTDGIDGWSRSSRALDGVIAKVQSFGGRVEELTPTGLVAAFGFDPAVKPYPYDPERARQLLREANYPADYDFVVNVPVGRYLNDKTIGEAIVLDLTFKGSPHARITPEDMDRAEAALAA
jgi:hypothetical protein